ncbi:hypothetical protein [Streptomyces sp. NPDC054838]
MIIIVTGAEQLSTYTGRPGAGQRNSDRNGCVTFLLLPFVLAGRIYRPGRPDRIVDESIERAQIARTAIGIVATCWLLFAYPLRESAGSVLSDKVGEVVISAGLLLVLGPIALAVFVMSARPPGPAFYRQRLRGPLTALGTLFGTALLLWLAVTQGTAGSMSLLGFGSGLLALFLLPFGMASAVLCVHHAFRTGDVHEVLPPLITPVLVWAMFLLQLFDDAPVLAPLPVRILFLIGPPASVTALSLWELRRLRTMYGITLRLAVGR